MTSPSETVTQRTASGWAALLRQRETGIAIAALVLFLLLAILSPNFRTQDNLLNVVRQISLMGIVATGMTLLFVAGELDLSVGTMYVMLTIVEAYLLIKLGWPLWLGITATLLLGALCGLTNALITTRMRIPAFITTLGTMSVFTGVSLVVSDGFPISGLNAPAYKAITASYVFGFLPAPSSAIRFMPPGATVRLPRTWGFRLTRLRPLALWSPAFWWRWRR